MCFIGFLHLQNPACCFFDLAGVRQPSLLDLQATPFGQPLVLLRLEPAQFHGQQSALVSFLDHPQGSTDICGQHEQQNKDFQVQAKPPRALIEPLRRRTKPRLLSRLFSFGYIRYITIVVPYIELCEHAAVV